MDKKNILVVDDEENTRKLIGLVLKGAGYEVFMVKSGKEALQFLEHQMPDVIILDIVMPDMDGYSFLKNVKSNAATKNLPIIISSGKSKMKKYFDLEDESFKPTAFLSKPFKVKVLVDIVKKTLQNDDKE